MLKFETTPIPEKVVLSDIGPQDNLEIQRIRNASFPAKMIEGMDLNFQARKIKEGIIKLIEKNIPPGFFIEDKGVRIGYLLLAKDSSMSNPNEDALFIDDFAILPEHRGKGLKFIENIFDQVLDIAKKNNLPIEAYAREKTIYGILKYAQQKGILEKKGLNLTEGDIMRQEGEGENMHFIRVDFKTKES